MTSIRVLLLLALTASLPAAEPAYDPGPLPAAAKPAGLALEVPDAARNRTIPILAYLPPGEPDAAAPVVLFSHGLGGSRHGCTYLAHHWAAHGYVAVFLQHPGSDDTVWRDVEPAQIMEAMREAASGANFLARVRDVPAVLDQLERWNGQHGHPLQGRLDLERLGMSGHSFGAVTTQAVIGQRSPLGQTPFLEPRIDAAIAFSPSPPQRGSAEQAYGAIEIPVLTMTGTLDGDPVRGRLEPADRRQVFAALPAGDKFELVFQNGRHSAFSDRPMRREPPRHERIHPAILAVTTAFWDAHLRGDAAASAWLRSDAVRHLLLPEDVWRWK